MEVSPLCYYIPLELLPPTSLRLFFWCFLVSLPWFSRILSLHNLSPVKLPFPFCAHEFHIKASIHCPRGSLFLIQSITFCSSGKHFVESATPLPCDPFTRDLRGNCQVACWKAMNSEKLPVACAELDERRCQR